MKALVSFLISSLILLLSGQCFLAADPDLAAGNARGSLAYEGATAELKFASAFVDEKEEGKPVVLILSDTKLATEKWTSEFDMMRESSKWRGVVFFLKGGDVFRSDIHMKGKQTSVSGYFDLKLADPKSKDLIGTAKSSDSSTEPKLDAAFHAALK